MKIIHFFNQENQIEKEVSEEPGFLLTNKLGGYLWLESEPTSRYQGWFFTLPGSLGKKIFKVMENIEVPNAPRVSELRNNFWNTERKRGKLKESFFLPSDFNALLYETSQPADIEITLDIKESYDNPEWGRGYEIYKKANLIIVKYTQGGVELPPIFLAIKSAQGKAGKISQWILRDYSFDQQRSSFPFERYVFKALKLSGAQKIVFAVSKNEREAVKTAKYVFEKSTSLKKAKQREIAELAERETIKNKEIRVAYLSAKNSLRGFLVSLPCQKGRDFSLRDSTAGLYGGLPWFFQFWPRDEAICLRALAKFQEKEAKEIFWRHIETINKEGKIFGADDALGWVFKRASDFILQKRFSKKELAELKECLKKAIERYLKTETKQGFALNNPRQTWMDTRERAPAALEIQALRLNLYKLAAKLSGLGKEKRFYSKLEKKLRKKVKKAFWNGKILADGFDVEKGTADFTIRPNVFLATYIYPELLTRKEWTKCFQNVLPQLFFHWGGVSTINKEHPLFQPFHTGEPSLSYHQGDSWFFINNLTALVLYKVNKKKFKNYIDKILEASTKEILWQGIAGHHGELSSAEIFRSQGCPAQAWSSAAYLELVKGDSPQKQQLEKPHQH